MGRLWRVALLATLLVSVNADAQVIEFESAGLSIKPYERLADDHGRAPVCAGPRLHRCSSGNSEWRKNSDSTIRPKTFFIVPKAASKSPRFPPGRSFTL